ncbi:anhydro-N-acetylmuramic acid kinase [Legionella beliardensis]|uniref:Anhydro-N-acetylmuramic acid kinase n=1 Tax=Legionella beliardensis TaxID=91822 RepID=A0A378I194_9GAMM|nr:anhydro-N-acetylmuramic acid kinase [Legionella beliardensis]STX28958.1 anhydro-N-acetylmuramic acid kinase [Legionella beliardensis]
MELYIGIMSGTSMDGIDVALVDLTKNEFLYGMTCPYSLDVKARLRESIAMQPHDLGYFSQLHTLLGREFANAVLLLLEKSNHSAQNIIAIGSHGQTLCHNTMTDIPYTVQLGCAHTIAEMTGITVVADFRTRDLVVGGQGAPFAPVYHQAIFKDFGYPLAVVNIGGIANLTYLKDEFNVCGFDVGPGNCLMDAWIYQHLKQDYDQNGNWASQGNVIEPLLNDLLQDPYLLRTSPKSIGREYFSLEWLSKYCHSEYKPVDIQATLLQLTAVSIATSINTKSAKPKHLFVCGGGAHNQLLLKELAQLLPQVPVLSTQAVNCNPDFIEALMMAWLADKTLNQVPLDLKAITGANYPAILGVIYPAGIDKRNSLAV